MARLLALLWLSVLACSAEAALPAVGSVVTGWIEPAALVRIPLPAGQWSVEKVYDQPTRAGKPEHNLVLRNIEPQADVRVLVLEFTLSADYNWLDQPCDEPPKKNLLSREGFQTHSNAVLVRCRQISLFTNLRDAVRNAASHKSEWFADNLQPFMARADDFPLNGIVVQGYLSRMKSDRMRYTLYLDPTRQGLADQPGRPSVLSNPAAQPYLDTLQRWSDTYIGLMTEHFLERSLFAGTPQVPMLQFAPGSAATAGPRSAPATTPATAVATTITPGMAGATTPPRPVTTALQVHALVIGNGAYPGAPLSNPRNDANAIAQRLKTYGARVTLLLDAKRKSLVDGLARFAQQARQADVTILFYAGHGMQVGGVNYLIPTDFNLAGSQAINVALDAVSLNSLLEQYLPGKTKLVFLDACRDNPLARSLAATRGGGGQGLAPINAATGTLISYATRDGSVAADGRSSNSPYTTALLAHLDEQEDIAIVLRKVRQQVLTHTQGAQEPWEYGSLIGDKLVLSQIGRRP
jgi:hypothetical protein